MHRLRRLRLGLSVILPDKFNEDLSPRRAAYKLYPQATPNAYAIEKKASPPVETPARGQRAQGYIALIREGRYDDALRVIKEDNPFPGICGRICNHRCETACKSHLVDEPLNIHALKRLSPIKSTTKAMSRRNLRAQVRSARGRHRRGPCG